MNSPPAENRAPNPFGPVTSTTWPNLPVVDLTAVPLRNIPLRASSAAALSASGVRSVYRKVSFVRPTTSGCFVNARPACVKAVSLKRWVAAPMSASFSTSLSTDSPALAVEASAMAAPAAFRSALPTIFPTLAASSSSPAAPTTPRPRPPVMTVAPMVTGCGIIASPTFSAKSSPCSIGGLLAHSRAPWRLPLIQPLAASMLACSAMSLALASIAPTTVPAVIRPCATPSAVSTS